MFVEISVTVIAVAFAAFVVYAIIALRAVKDSLLQANRTLTDLERQVDTVSREAVKLLDSTHRMTEDLNRKLERIDGFFESVNDVGEAVQQVSTSVKQVSATVANSLKGSVNKGVHTHQNKIDTIIQWANASVSLWQTIRSLKTKNHKGED